MKKAFTLIELLVTIVLFSLLIGVAFYSFRFASMDIKSVNNTNPKEAIYYHMLRSIINSIYPYINESGQKIEYFFKGNRKECYFISSKGIFFKKVILGHLYFNSQKLFYEESMIFNKNINYKELDKIKFLKRLVVSEYLTEVDFFYLLSNKFYSEVINKIPSTIYIKIDKDDKIREYYFNINIDNTSRLKSILGTERGI